MKLRSRLFLLVAGTLIPVVVLAVCLGALLVDHERETFRRLAMDRNRAFMTGVDAEIRGHLTTLHALAANSALHGGNLRAFHTEAVRALKSQPDWENVILSAPDGSEVLHGLREFGEALPRDPDPESLRRAIADRAAVAGDVVRWESIGKYGIAARVPVIEDDKVIYVLSAVIATRQFEQMIQAQNLPAGWISGLVDARGYFIARIPALSSGDRASEGFLRATQVAPEGWYRGKTVEGLDTFTAHVTSRFSSWSLGLGVPTHLVYASATRFGWALATGTLLTLAVALGFALWMSRRITVPIAALAANARAIGTQTTALPPAPESFEEVRDVQRALAAADFAVREREALQKREQVALKAADRSKDEFLAMLGHELRNPLSAITTSSHVLRAAPVESRMHQQALVIIERQARQMARLVDDLLDVSRLTMGKVELRVEPFDVALLARQLVQTWEGSGRIERGRIVLAADSASVAGDRARIEQVIANLLDNANRYTPPGRHIHLRVAPEGDQAVVEVTDEGPGIDPAMLPNVFKAFVQAPQGTDRSEGGLGLGLAVVERIALLHGGTAHAENVEGGGARFIVRLPAAGTVRPARAKAAPAPVPKGLTVLVVEDGDDAREMLHALLSLQGHDVRTAATGAEALEVAKGFDPDVILLDIGLPDIDGYEVARRLRSLETTRTSRLVALTGYGQTEDEKRAYASGFDLHITKPIEPQALTQLLAELSATATSR